MANPKHQPPDDPSSAPESGTVRDDTSGNNPANPQQRPAPGDAGRSGQGKDDPSVAGEER